MQKFQQGDIVKFSLPDGRTAIGWILHISEMFGPVTVFGFIVFGTHIEDFDYSEANLLALPFHGPFYASLKDAVADQWETIGFQSVSKEAFQLTRRLYAAREYIGDECIGPASTGDTSLKSMGPSGMLYNYKVIQKAMGLVSTVDDAESAGRSKTTAPTETRTAIQRLEQISFKQAIHWCDAKIKRSVLHHLSQLRTELIAGEGTRRKAETAALFKSCIGALNEIQEETHLILTEERDAICDVLQEMGLIVGFDSVSEKLDRWRKW